LGRSKIYQTDGSGLRIVLQLFFGRTTVDTGILADFLRLELDLRNGLGALLKHHHQLVPILLLEVPVGLFLQGRDLGRDRLDRDTILPIVVLLRIVLLETISQSVGPPFLALLILRHLLFLGR